MLPITRHQIASRCCRVSSSLHPLVLASSSSSSSSLLLSTIRNQSSAASPATVAAASVNEQQSSTIISSENSSSLTSKNSSLSSSSSQQQQQQQFCILCDEPVSNWQQHAATTRHTARFAVAQELCAPERNAAMLAQLWDHIRLDFNAVDAASEQRVRRRRRRLSSTTKYLRDVHILQDCLLFENVNYFQNHQKSSVNQKQQQSNDENGTTETSTATNNNNTENQNNEIATEKQSVIERVFFDEQGNERSTADVERLLMTEIFTVAPSFSKLVHVGERAARAELVDRCARLFPASAATEIESIISLIMSPLSMAAIFDILDLKDVVYTRYKIKKRKIISNTERGTQEEEEQQSQQQEQEQESAATYYEEIPVALPTTKDQESLHLVALPDQVKRQIILAIIGELSLWNTRDRPTSVGSKQDADTIVTHVLAVHVVENILSELLHHSVQKVVDETTPVWREFKDGMSKMVMTSNRPTMRLSKEKETETKNNKKKMTALDALNFMKGKEEIKQKSEIKEKSDGNNDSEEQQLLPFTSLPEILDSFTGDVPPQPKLVWRTMQMEGVLSTTVPKPEAKDAMFALPKPQLTSKAKLQGVAAQTPQQASSGAAAMLKNNRYSSSSSSSSQQQQSTSTTNSTNNNNTTTSTMSTEDILKREQDALQKEQEVEEKRKRNENTAKILAELQKSEKAKKEKEMEEQRKARQLQQQMVQQQQQQQKQQQVPEPKATIKKPLPVQHQQQQNQAPPLRQQPLQQQQRAPMPPNQQNVRKPMTPQQARAPHPGGMMNRPGQQQQQKIVTMSTIKSDPNKRMRLQPVNHPPKPK